MRIIVPLRNSFILLTPVGLVKHSGQLCVVDYGANPDIYNLIIGAHKNVLPGNAKLVLNKTILPI